MGGGGMGGLGLVPHQSAIYEALFDVWVFHFFNVRSGEDTHHSGFVFVPVNVTSTALRSIFATDSNAAKRMCGLLMSNSAALFSDDPESPTSVTSRQCDH